MIKRKKTVIIACDVDIERFEKILRETSDIELVGAYKIGFSLAVEHGLPHIVRTARNLTDKPLIYDHQKAGTDIPDTACIFAEKVAGAGINAVIIFPLAGPETEKRWIIECRKAGLKVIIGGMMTHKGYLESDGGFISDRKVLSMYRIAAESGVTDFVVPGNQPEKINEIRELVEKYVKEPVYYAPGLIAQGGSLSSLLRMKGRVHVIIGRAIYESDDIRKKTLELCSMIDNGIN